MPRPSEPLTVLHVDTERGWRGGERQALWLATGLAARGHRSIVAARPDEPLAKRASSAGLSVRPVRPWGGGETGLLTALRLHHTIRAERVDIVHAHTAHAVTLGALAIWRTPAQLVVTRRVDFRLRANAGTRWKYARASAIIAISGAVARALADSGVADARVVVIPSGIDTTRRVDPVAPAILAALGVPAGAPLVVQVAQLVGHKDPLTFVRAIAALHRVVPTAHAIMVGDGPLAGAVADAIRAAGLGAVLHLAGYRADADAFIAAADVVTLSSREEGMGTVLLDAMAVGGVPVATAAGGIPEVIEDGMSGLVVPIEDGDALGMAIARVLGDRPLADRLRAGARARVAAFSVDATIDRTLAVYRQVRADRTAASAR
jgi:glycosyltransferase involved in cell wall biosynthesis